MSSSLLPWGVIISEYCTFQESLKFRLVCQTWRSSIDESMSRSKCSNFIVDHLKKKNIFLLSKDLDQWDTTSMEERAENVANLLQCTRTPRPPGDASSSLSLLKCLFNVMKVLKQFPSQVAVAFSLLHGRHCMPIEWDAEERMSVLKYYNPCCNRPSTNCVTCQLPLPIRSDRSSSREQQQNLIYNHLELRNGAGEIDLTKYTAKCIPNLPADLYCPCCQTTDERTLVLSEFSYQSTRLNTPPVTAPNRIPLRWSPKPHEVAEVDRTNPQSSMQQNNTTARGNSGAYSPRKRLKSDPQLSKETTVDTNKPSKHIIFPPPQYDDLATPTRDEPLEAKPDTSHAISLHCTKCQKFAVVAPAALCWNKDYCCPEKGRHLEDGTILGGVYSRTKCSVSTCLLPTPCYQCSRSNFHDSYNNTGGANGIAGEPQRIRRRAASCEPCRQTYCAEHSWITTVCHHW